jgi:hypothetical protein
MRATHPPKIDEIVHLIFDFELYSNCFHLEHFGGLNDKQHFLLCKDSFGEME